MRKAIGAISGNSRKRRSRKIIRALVRTVEFKQARNIMTYIPISGEVDTRTVLLSARKGHKKIYVPKINSSRKTIAAIRISNPSLELKKGKYGILEPCGRHLSRLNPAKIDLVIVPGLGFDRSGGRLGRGAGYFDRFLKRTKKAKKIGLAFREQMRKKIPMESHDVFMDRVIAG
ncbi:MAG: 5-formyltetrahydrofolate cyclo-ligase [Candidatus Omnitrophica bacterium]|nr:5-formyltetrahydrofolate cyclo-ligase [Candidatus Omnitrophota bacterium]